MSATARRTLWLKSETERARLFWLSEPGKQPTPLQMWVPRSVCKSVLKFALEPGQGWRRCEVEIEEWWWEKSAKAREEAQRELEI